MSWFSVKGKRMNNFTFTFGLNIMIIFLSLYTNPRRRWENGPSGNSVGRCRLDECSSEKGPVTGSSKHGNEPSGFIKGGEFLNELSDY